MSFGRSFDDWKTTEPDRGQRPEPSPCQTRLACRCGADMTYATAIGHLSMETVCVECAKAEGAEYLRRRAK